MKFYEAMIILQPNLNPDKSQEDIQKVKDVIIKNGGTIQSEIKWGKRSLAYSIKKKREGYYVIFHFDAPPTSIINIASAYRIMEEDVLRAMILQIEKPEIAKVA